ncbi:MAG: tRNA lysidine(34) synthetase TilS [Burkholderiales bacterium]|nr:tRNA lysidine(34) synthetase TilS [Burkholderiales bacterium]
MADETPDRAHLPGLVAEALARDLPAGAPILVALSGGRDSVALLAALRAVAPPRGHVVCAAHVDHGLSPHAPRWRAFCGELCARWDVPFLAATVAVRRADSTSLEAAARRARYTALVDLAARAGCRHVALAHHRDDQAETLLLQLLRGAGPRGLAAMPPLRDDARGIAWWRPLLDADRADIDAYVQSHGLDYVDDESNAGLRHRRNALRHLVMPALREVAPQAVAAIARAAQHQAEAARLADDLARLDAGTGHDPATLACATLAALPRHRARNLLRFHLRGLDLPAPSTARLAAMLDQLTTAASDARVAIEHAGVVLGVYRGVVHVHAPVPPPYDVEWRGEATLTLPHGTLGFGRGPGGIAAARLPGPLRVRRRRGGERFRLAPDRPRRALKAILHDADWPPWARASVPLIVAGDRLVAVPGLGIDPAFAASAGDDGIVVRWQARPLEDWIAKPP